MHSHPGEGARWALSSGSVGGTTGPPGLWLLIDCASRRITVAVVPPNVLLPPLLAYNCMPGASASESDACIVCTVIMIHAMQEYWMDMDRRKSKANAMIVESLSLSQHRFPVSCLFNMYLIRR